MRISLDKSGWQPLDSPWIKVPCTCTLLRKSLTTASSWNSRQWGREASCIVSAFLGKSMCFSYNTEKEIQVWEFLWINQVKPILFEHYPCFNSGSKYISEAITLVFIRRVSSRLVTLISVPIMNWPWLEGSHNYLLYVWSMQLWQIIDCFSQPQCWMLLYVCYRRWKWFWSTSWETSCCWYKEVECMNVNETWCEINMDRILLHKFSVLRVAYTFGFQPLFLCTF